MLRHFLLLYTATAAHIPPPILPSQGNYYPPGSYYIGNVGTHISATHGHGHGHWHQHSRHAAAAHSSADPYFHSPCMFQPGSVEPHSSSSLGHHHHDHEETHSQSGSVAHHDHSLAGRSLKAGKFDKKGSNPHHDHHASSAAAAAGAPSSESDPPTGELCGSVFWTFFNQRFHRLFPDNETFVFEMERSIVNVGLSALGYPGSGGQGPNGTGIRYFFNQVRREAARAAVEQARVQGCRHSAPLCFSLRPLRPLVLQHKQSQSPSMHSSCCEGQGTRLFGSLAEYIYTLALAPAAAAASAAAAPAAVASKPLPAWRRLATPAAAVASAVYVDLYAASNVSFAVPGGTASLVQDTAWPCEKRGGTGQLLPLFSLDGDALCPPHLQTARPCPSPSRCPPPARASTSRCACPRGSRPGRP